MCSQPFLPHSFFCSDNDAKVAHLQAFLAAADPALLVTPDQLADILTVTPSVRTRVKLIGLVAPRLTDPKERADYFLSLFRYAEEKAQVEEFLKARATALHATAFVRFDGPGGRGGRGGRGRGPSAHALRVLPPAPSSPQENENENEPPSSPSPPLRHTPAPVVFAVHQNPLAAAAAAASIAAAAAVEAQKRASRRFPLASSSTEDADRADDGATKRPASVARYAAALHMSPDAFLALEPQEPHADLLFTYHELVRRNCAKDFAFTRGGVGTTTTLKDTELDKHLRPSEFDSVFGMSEVRW